MQEMVDLQNQAERRNGLKMALNRRRSGQGNSSRAFLSCRFPTRRFSCGQQCKSRSCICPTPASQLNASCNIQGFWRTSGQKSRVKTRFRQNCRNSLYRHEINRAGGCDTSYAQPATIKLGWKMSKEPRSSGALPSYIFWFRSPVNPLLPYFYE